MAILELVSYRKKGIVAYLVPSGAGIEGMDFGTPKTTDDQEKGYRGKSHTVVIDLATKADGAYKYKEAIGHKTDYGWIVIKGGEIDEEFDSEADLLRSMCPATDLPDLKGSEKQIAWASQIRDEFIRAVGDRITDWGRGSAAYECLESVSLAKTWIDGRDKLNPQKFVDRVKKLELEYQTSEKELHLEDRIAEEAYKQLVTRDDEVLSEVSAYAVVYGDRIEVTANETGMGDRFPRPRKYIGDQQLWRWEYPVSAIEDIKNCKAIDFVLDSEGRKIR